VKTPQRQQFRPSDFESAESAASKLDYSFQQVREQFIDQGARQILNLDFVYSAAIMPLVLPQIRLDKVAGFNVLACAGNGTVTVPIAPPLLVPALVTWDKTDQQGRPAWRLRSLYVAVGGAMTGHRYTLTLEAIGG
jgi:hypothetical protein